MQLSPEIERKVKHSFVKQSMMATFSAKLVSVEPGRVEISAPVGANCLQQHGFGHAALTFGIGDSAAGYAALSVMPLETEVLTSEMKIHLLAPARGDMLHAIGRVIKTGKRLVIVQADVFACTGSDRSHIAFLTGTMIPVSATSKA